MHLTDAAVSSYSSERQFDVYDTVQKRFGVRVSKKAKTFFVFAGEPRRRVSLGRYPGVSLKQARKAAQKHLLEPDDNPSTITFKTARETYLTAYIEPNYRDRSAYNTKRLLRLVDHLEDKALAQITIADITAVLDDLKPSQANHLYGVLKTFFGWCERRDYIPASPIRKLAKPHKEKERKRTLSDAELKAVWGACENDIFGKIVRMLILTGQRRGEISALETGWIADGSITFPPHITKNGQEHTIPLAALSRRILREQSQPPTSKIQSQDQPSPTSTLLFASERTGSVLIGFQKLKRDLDKRSGVTAWTLHDLRRTWSTKSADLGTPPHVIERCLNHLTGSITPLARRYNKHQYLAEMKEAFDRFDAYVSDLILETT